MVYLRHVICFSSKLLVSPSRNPIVVPYIQPHLRSLDYSLYGDSANGRCWGFGHGMSARRVRDPKEAYVSYIFPKTIRVAKGDS